MIVTDIFKLMPACCRSLVLIIYVCVGEKLDWSGWSVAVRRFSFWNSSWKVISVLCYSIFSGWFAGLAIQFQSAFNSFHGGYWMIFIFVTLWLYNSLCHLFFFYSWLKTWWTCWLNKRLFDFANRKRYKKQYCISMRHWLHALQNAIW